eukprot:CAMPEP_0178950804 /NCGR_PEP_ID=MMETSP0789-20121207/6858_1 /TAXON_ID=3005 /ORGANISM="Rhizosolenia setigera, Strain CCMP 1694" /LENGTH=609 /DNA_ID=CAMNT_0020631575 /DNA_START=65 /DNA_END=1894 /DNA_ORIENTATION=-
MSLSLVDQNNNNNSNAVKILCCLCGVEIFPNAANQCASCLANQFDLKEIMNKGPSNTPLTIHQCRRCRRYETSTQGRYMDMEPESPELMSLLLKKIPALQNHHSTQNNIANIKLIESMYVWTEPNSMRMRLRLTVRADVDATQNNASSVTIQQRVMVEFIVKFSQCPECNREFTNRTWHCVVQLRQKNDGNNRKGLILIESAIAKHPLIKKRMVIKIDTTKNGFDFYFMSLANAQSFASFLAKIAPMKIKTTKKMVSEDVKNNTANMKYTMACNMVPLCRDDLVLICKSGSYQGGGNISNLGKLDGCLALVIKVRSCVHLIDATPSRSAPSIEDLTLDLNADKYFKAEKGIQVVLNPKRLVRFVVLDVELCDADGNNKHHNNHAQGGGEGDNESDRLYKGPRSGVDKYALADVQVVRESDFGQNDDCVFHQCVTHLGNLLSCGDIVLGYDLTTSVLPISISETPGVFHNSFTMPDVVLVKKIQGVNDNIIDEGNKKKNNVGQEEEESKAGGGGRRKKGAKSSASKRREKRLRKQQLKEQELERTAQRMGLISPGEDDELEKEELEQELEQDAALKKELELAEKEFSKMDVKDDDTEGKEEEEAKRSLQE